MLPSSDCSPCSRTVSCRAIRTNSCRDFPYIASTAAQGMNIWPSPSGSIATYEQRAEFLDELLGVRVSKSTICRTIKRLGYTRKKDQWARVRETSG